MRIQLTILLLTVSALTIADERILLPNGTGCWINNNGHVYGCSGGPKPGGTNAGTAARTPTTCIELEAKLANINRRLRQGYSSRQGNILKAKRREYEDILDRRCK